MGMYTEFHFNVELKKDTPLEVLRILRFMTGQESFSSEELSLPDHYLFTLDRWKYMLRTDSYYFPAQTFSKLYLDKSFNTYYLNIRCNLKNYNQEIQHFIDWIKPYLQADEGDFLGFYRYEESNTPTLLNM